MDDRFTVPGKTQTVTATQVAETEQARKNASGAAVENGTARFCRNRRDKNC